MVKSQLRDGPIKYYQIYPLGGNPHESIVIKLQGSKLDSLTNYFDENIKIETLNYICGVHLGDEGVKVDSGYNIGLISSKKAYKKFMDSRENGMPKWAGHKLMENVLREVTM